MMRRSAVVLEVPAAKLQRGSINPALSADIPAMKSRRERPMSGAGLAFKNAPTPCGAREFSIVSFIVSLRFARTNPTQIFD
jgi:hypothetical protein